jgi:signal transduction histidine kinase
LIPPHSLTDQDEGMQDSTRPSLPIRAKHRAEALRALGDEETATLVTELAAENESVRRQLVRLGFDLHDGPLQGLAGVTMDLRHFQAQLSTALGRVADGHKLVNRVDDLLARALELSEQVRRLILGTDADPATASRLSTVFAGLSETSDTFTLHVTVEPAADDLPLSDSQRITLVRVVRGALDNVAQHSGARNAWVTVRSLDGSVEAQVVDDGSGFDPRPSKRPERSIGLTAMEERVRMLDGELTIDSQPGGPTTVRVVLPPWRRDESL